MRADISFVVNTQKLCCFRRLFEIGGCVSQSLVLCRPCFVIRQDESVLTLTGFAEELSWS